MSKNFITNSFKYLYFRTFIIDSSITPLLPRVSLCPLQTKFLFQFKKGSPKIFPMSVSTRYKPVESIVGHVPKKQEKNNLGSIEGYNA